MFRLLILTIRVTLINQLKTFIFDSVGIAPLVTFRILFGGLMAFGALRFWTNGWIEKLYFEPKFFFKFYGFEWVQVPDAQWIYLLFALVILSAVGIMVGLFYRASAIIFFLSFTYSQLLDATNYLNHYYLVCLLAFLLIFLPANGDFSLDIWRKPHLKKIKIPAWCINILIFQLCCVYFFAGLAKVNPDWLLRAMPMAIWLPERTATPLLGYFFQFKETAFVFSWAGAFYDLTIWVFLLNSRTRTIAYLGVIVFHVLTKILFNIGLFPVIMICSTLIFFPTKGHEESQNWVRNLFKKRLATTVPKTPKHPCKTSRITVFALVIYVSIQLLFPLRHYLYPGNILWTEEGYRFSWRVMLVEKTGLATFYVQDTATPKRQEIVNRSHLTFYQEKQMSIQPDFILQYAHFLKKEYEEKHGFKNPIVTVDAYVAMNGRRSRRFIDPSINLAEIEDSFKAKKWILK